MPEPATDDDPRVLTVWRQKFLPPQPRAQLAVEAFMPVGLSVALAFGAASDPTSPRAVRAAPVRVPRT